MKRDIWTDAARVVGGVMNVASGVRHQIRNDLRTRAEDMADRLDLVPRSDLERVELLLQDALKRIADLETKSKTTGKKKKAA